eukprot:Skav225421  [mRNA]  locus=scaffold680:80745:84851:- [translate_table: standard]
MAHTFHPPTAGSYGCAVALRSDPRNGVEPAEVGLMTIGAPDYSGCRTEDGQGSAGATREPEMWSGYQLDFETLKKCREEAAAATGMDVESLELSMGMSADYENAIREGSTSVRVGSSIFGARHYPAKAS